MSAEPGLGLPWAEQLVDSGTCQEFPRHVLSPLNLTVQVFLRILTVCIGSSYQQDPAVPDLGAGENMPCLALAQGQRCRAASGGDAPSLLRQMQGRIDVMRHFTNDHTRW